MTGPNPRRPPPVVRPSYSSAVQNRRQANIFDKLLGILARGREADRSMVRFVKRQRRNAHYHKCNCERGINPKSFYRRQAELKAAGKK